MSEKRKEQKRQAVIRYREKNRDKMNQRARERYKLKNLTEKSQEEKEKKRLYDIEYRKREDVIRKEKERKENKEYKQREKELRPIRRQKNLKNIKYNEWRKLNIKWDLQYQDPYKMYLENKVCSLCKCEYKTNSDKQLDHDHLSGHIRGFVCRGCNSKMAKYDNQRIRLCLEIHRYFNNK